LFVISKGPWNIDAPLSDVAVAASLLARTNSGGISGKQNARNWSISHALAATSSLQTTPKQVISSSVSILKRVDEVLRGDDHDKNNSKPAKDKRKLRGTLVFQRMKEQRIVTTAFSGNFSLCAKQAWSGSPTQTTTTKMLGKPDFLLCALDDLSFQGEPLVTIQRLDFVYAVKAEQDRAPPTQHAMYD